MADIVAAIEEAPQERSAQDLTHDLWNDLHTTLMAHMKTISLRSLAADQKAKGFKVEERKVSTKGILAKLKPEPARSLCGAAVTCGKPLGGLLGRR